MKIQSWQDTVLTLAARCTNLDSCEVGGNHLHLDQLHRLDLLLDRKRLHTEAQALGGAPVTVVFQKLLQANSHEHGLSAAFVILRDHPSYDFAEQLQHTSSSNRQKGASDCSQGQAKEEFIKIRRTGSFALYQTTKPATVCKSFNA